MEKLILKHQQKINAINMSFERDLENDIDWDDRLIGIKGQRGVGKTTMLLQHIHRNYKNSRKALYISLDDLYFTGSTLVDLAERFAARGGEFLGLDEVHHYNNWAQEIKNIYDDIPELKIVFTGSSLIRIRDSRADLSRRAAFFEMSGLSFREYINFTTKKHIPRVSILELLKNHTEMALELKKEFTPLPLFDDYLRKGYFPFIREVPKTFMTRVGEVINTSLDVDIMHIKGLNTSGLAKMKQLLYIIAQSVPFKPNVVKLSERIGINRITLLSYLHHLEDARIIRCLYSSAQGISAMQKPEKIYLENTVFMHALCDSEPDTGTLRETFFLNHVQRLHSVTYTDKGDFVVNSKFHFEVGGLGKGNQQLKGVKHGYVAAGDLEVGIDRKIPLWLFGFLA